MAAGVFDLSDTTVLLPGVFIVDTNILFAHLLVPFFSAPAGASGSEASQQQDAQRAAALFRRLADEEKIGLVTPIVYSEFIHLAIKALYQRLGRQRGLKADWIALYKANPAAIQTFQAELSGLRTLLIDGGLVLISPDEFDRIDPHTSYDQRLIELCGTYRLDTTDAGILFEAERLDVDAIVTLDADLRRARTDFDIYTWL